MVGGGRVPAPALFEPLRRATAFIVKAQNKQTGGWRYRPNAKDGDTSVGNHVRAKVVKNKVSAPFKTAEFDLTFESGISREGDLIDLGVECDIVQKSGAWLNYGEMRLGQGR